MTRFFAITLCLLLAVAVPQARAAMIETGDPERERVKAMLERPELAKALEKLGLTPTQAVARVDALGDGEVLQLAGKLDSAIAAGQISNETLLLIIILVLVLIILL